MIGIQGQRGSYTHAAAMEMYGPEAEMLHLNTFEETFEALRQERVDRAVVAIANSRFGFTDAYPVFTDPRYCDDYWADRETVGVVSHCVVAKEGVDLEEITTLTSQKEALGQCNRFIASLNGRVQTVLAKDTALAAKQVAEGNQRDIAAIANEATVSVYPGLHVVKRGVQDDKLNLTRFISVVRRSDAVLADPNPDTTIGKLKLSQKDGSLSAALGVLARHSMGLGFINSQHIPNTPLAVDIIVQIEAGYTDPRFRVVIEELAREEAIFQPLGTYKAHELDFDHVAEWHKDAQEIAKKVHAAHEVKVYDAMHRQLTSPLG